MFHLVLAKKKKNMRDYVDGLTSNAYIENNRIDDNWGLVLPQMCRKPQKSMLHNRNVVFSFLIVYIFSFTTISLFLDCTNIYRPYRIFNVTFL